MGAFVLPILKFDSPTGQAYATVLLLLLQAYAAELLCVLYSSLEALEPLASTRGAGKCKLASDVGVFVGLWPLFIVIVIVKCKLARLGKPL